MSELALPTYDSSLSSCQRVSTRALLVDLGFEAVTADYTDQQPGYRYDFGNFVLHASQVTGKYFQPEMFFTGVMSTPRTLGMVDFSLLMDVESYEQGVALIAHNLGRRFTPTRATPWLLLGRMWEEHLPGRREMRLRAKSPRCHINAEWFRVAVKKLIAHSERLDGSEVFSVSFLADVVRFEIGGETMVMPATGEAWTETCCCPVKGLRHLSNRTPSEGVWLEVWQGHLTIGKLRMPLTGEIGK